MKILFACLFCCCTFATIAGTFNYLQNADFSALPESGIPLGWGTMHWGLWDEDFPAWQQGWRMDNATSRDGIPSFLMDTALCGRSAVYLASCINGAPAGQKTFSVYLKTDKPGSTAVIDLTFGEQQKQNVELTADWQRFSISFDNAATSGRVAIHALADSRVFINSPQLEAGTEATPFRTRESFPVTGDFDFAGNNGKHFQLTHPDGSAMQYPTDVTMSADDEGLRFTLVNAIPETRTTAGNYILRDNDLWVNNDTIQLFLYPTGSENALLQFIISSNGTIQDLRSTNAGWDGVWDVKTEFIPGKEWRADVFIPYAALNDGGKHLLQKDWKWLLGRENGLDGELGVSNVTRVSFFVFGCTDRWANLRNLPVSSVNNTQLRIGKPFAGDSKTILFPVTNHSRNDRTFTARRAVCFSNDPWQEMEDMELVIKAGETVYVPFTPPADFPGCRLTLLENGKIAAAKSENCSFATGLKATTYQPEELLIALFCEPKFDGFYPGVLTDIKALGYNSVIFIAPRMWGEEQVKGTLDRLEAAGLKGICNFDYHDADPAHYDFIKSIVSKYKDHPAIAGWIVSDEPHDYWGGIEFTQQGYKLLKELDKDHPIWINYTCNFKINRPLEQDMLGFDHYPIPDYDIREFLPMVEAYTQYGDTAFIYFQQTGHAYFYGREPSAAEFKFMGAASLLKGAVALGTFAQLPVSAELRAKAPEILGGFIREFPIWRGEKFDVLSPVPDIVEAEGRIADGKKYVIYLNTSKNEVTFTAIDGSLVILAPLDYVIKKI